MAKSANGIFLVVDGPAECSGLDAVVTLLEKMCLHQYYLEPDLLAAVVTFREDHGVCLQVKAFSQKWKCGRVRTITGNKSNDALRLVRHAVKQSSRHRVKCAGLMGPATQGRARCEDLKEAAYSLGIEYRCAVLPEWAFQVQADMFGG